ncbi:MAG: phage integrase N-terminal SAM-like domain-containing protein, partial [Desulfobacteraceae bacterium]|nr:phage integrase N-terminal SAM-like domain-containing protein [Desulfobacteraceae bacterium]
MALYFNKSPEQLSESEIKEYLLFLKDKRKLADGTFRFYYSGIKFLYKQVLKRDVVEGIRVSRRNKKLPVVLDLSEVE